MRRRESTEADGRRAPRCTSVSSAPASSCQTWRSAGNDAHTEPTVITPCSSSTSTPTQRASRRIHSTWSREEVGWTGTTSAPTVHRA